MQSEVDFAGQGLGLMVGLSGCGILRVPGLRDVGIKGSLFWGFGIWSFRVQVQAF